MLLSGRSETLNLNEEKGMCSCWSRVLTIEPMAELRKLRVA
jgi:hypothetical protein